MNINQLSFNGIKYRLNIYHWLIDALCQFV